MRRPTRYVSPFASAVLLLGVGAGSGLTPGGAPAASAATKAVTKAATKLKPPQPSKDHWHAALGIWNCGRYLPNIEAPDDPTGIHTHGDGLVHIHPFTAEAAGDNAIMQRFFDAANLKADSSSIQVPRGPSLKAGASCNGKKAAISMLVWKNIKDKNPKRIRSEFGKHRFTDQEVIVFVFDDREKVPALPPSVENLIEPGDLPLPELSASEMKGLPALPSLPTFDFTGTPPTKTEVKDISVGTGEVLKTRMRAYIRYTMYLARSKEALVTSWSSKEQPYALGRLGKGRNLAGLDKGLVGMKVGGVRRIVIPPADGFGPEGNPPIKGTDTLVFYVQLVSVKK